MSGQNVFIKGTGRKKIWNYVDELMKAKGYWNKMLLESSNFAAGDKHNLAFIPRHVHNYSKYDTNGSVIAQKCNRHIYTFVKYISRLSNLNQSSYSFISIYDY